MTAAIMIQGAGSNVGKSLIVSGLARLFARRGLHVCPFKPQNMSNNAAVTVDGGEIGRAQYVQAQAAGIEAKSAMNPILLKPQGDGCSQLVVRGKVRATVSARDYYRMTPKLLQSALASFGELSRDADLMLVEGAGSPAETNLRDHDIANMGFARAANLPVLMVGDIDRGGVIAQMVGTHAVLSRSDREQIDAFLINKFRGDAGLFADGFREIAQRTGWQGVGIVPWLESANLLPAEDSLAVPAAKGQQGGKLKIAILQLPRVSNFDDFDPLRLQPDVSIEMLRAGDVIGGDCDLVIIPGSKSVISDLAYVREQGWDVDLRAHHRRGGYILGVCGGYQMLGRQICDREGLEGAAGTLAGLGLLQVSSEIRPDKRIRKIKAIDNRGGCPVEGYEIHLGRTDGPDCQRPLFSIDGKGEGAISEDGRIFGTYLHGLFAADDFRHNFLQQMKKVRRCQPFAGQVERALDDLAERLQAHIDIDYLWKMARSRTRVPVLPD